MKKALALLLSLSLCLALAACGGGTSGAGTSGEAASGGETAGEAASGAAESGGASGGSVYYLNFKPEADQAWQALAQTYTQQTGVPVKIVTAASGEYNNTLTAEMGKSEAPTLFQCGNAQSLTDWGDSCYDFTGSAVLDEMTTDEFNLTQDGAVKAIGYCYEAFGIIVNKALLEQAGHSLDEITDFDSLKAVAEDIHARADELGFDAFTSSGLDGSSSWRFSGHLANMPLYYEFRDDGVTEQPAEITGAYLDNYRAIWDLYINNASASKTSLTTATGDMASSEFKEGKAAFYQNGTWEFSGMVDAGMNPDDLAMIPIYCGVDGEADAGLCCGTENCWAVNANSSPENIQATLDFLYWVVTSDEGTEMMAQEFGPIPFKNAKETSNVFFNDANAYMADGKYTVTWAFNHTPNVDSWRATLVSALAAYSADQSDANWEQVRAAFVDGWAYEYNVQNG
ncbi:MAG: ABC transporter substrate-binding protein [Oscillibacter sp.]|nr:ABC transporter substrate-binding protein [Oscillibacter sp.]